MRYSYVLGASLSAAVVFASPAQAAVFPDNPQYEIVPVQFSGTITNSVTDKIVVLDADGNNVPYTGPVPDYAFDTGDAITIGFDAIVPSSEAIANGLVPEAADGIYRFQVGPRPEQLDDFPGFASYTNFQGNGGISDTGVYSTDGGLTIVYNANTDSFAIDPGETGIGGDNFGIGFFDFPVLAYDVGTGQLFADTFLGLFPTNPGLAWSGTGSASGRVPIASIFNFDGGTYLGASAASLTGEQEVRFEGGWNLPLFGSSDPTPVPAPPMMVLFGLAAAGLLSRKKWASKAKVA